MPPTCVPSTVCVEEEILLCTDSGLFELDVVIKETILESCHVVIPIS